MICHARRGGMLVHEAWADYSRVARPPDVRFAPGHVGRVRDRPTLRLHESEPLTLFCELQMERTHIVGMTNLCIVEGCKPEVIRIAELVELHIVLATGHEFP